MKLARQSLKLRTFRTLAKPVSRVSSITNVPSGDGGCGGDCDCGAGRIMKNGYFCSQKRTMGSSSFLGAKTSHFMSKPGRKSVVFDHT